MRGMSEASSQDRERLIGLLKRDALKTGTFTLASGRSSHYYVDGRKVTLSAEGAALIGS
jgi:orotate phosphoribosyltransferase